MRGGGDALAQNRVFGGLAGSSLGLGSGGEALAAGSACVTGSPNMESCSPGLT